MSGLPLGVVELKSNIAGTEIIFPVGLMLDISSKENVVDVSVSSVIGMANLQSNFESIVKSFPMPNDTSGYGTKFVATLKGASLSPAGDGATLNADVNVVAWQIEKGVPLGGTSIHWETRCVNAPIVGKLCFDVPVTIEPKAGDDIKLRLFEEDVEGQIDLSLFTPDGNSLELRPTRVDVKPRGDIGKFFNEVAGIFNSNLSDVVRREIAEVINDGTLRKALPKEFQSFNPLIKTAHFSTSATGELEVIVIFTAQISGTQLTEWLAKSIG